MLLLVKWPNAGVIGIEQDTCVCAFNFTSFVICVNGIEIISHEAKLQAFVKMQMTRNQPKTFQNRRNFRELSDVTPAELS